MLPHCSGQRVPVAMPASVSISCSSPCCAVALHARTYCRFRTTALVSAAAADFRGRPEPARSTATRACRSSRRKWDWPSCKLGMSGNSCCCRFGSTKAVGDDLAIAAIGHRGQQTIVRHSRFGGFAGDLRRDRMSSRRCCRSPADAPPPRSDPPRCGYRSDAAACAPASPRQWPRRDR